MQRNTHRWFFYNWFKRVYGWVHFKSKDMWRMAWHNMINISEIIQKREDIRIRFNDSHFLFVSLPPNCRLTTPATVANLWVCTSIKAITISVTSWLTSMLTSHHWYHSSMQCSIRRTDIAALRAAAASASRWRQRCYVPITTGRATHGNCFVDWKRKGTNRSELIWTSTMSSA